MFMTFSYVVECVRTHWFSLFLHDEMDRCFNSAVSVEQSDSRTRKSEMWYARPLRDAM